MENPVFYYDRTALHHQQADDRVGGVSSLRDTDRDIDINSPGAGVDWHIDERQEEHGQHPNPAEPPGGALRDEIRRKEDSASQAQPEPLSKGLVIGHGRNKPEC